MLTSKGYQEKINSENGRGLNWTTSTNDELPIKMPAVGLGSEVKPDTLPNVFRKVRDERLDAPALRVMRNKKEFIWTWTSYYDQVYQLAKSLRAVGLQERKAINICAFNSPEWAIAFFGATFANCVASGVYQTNAPEARVYQAQHSEAQVIFVDTAEQMKIYMSILDKLPEVKAVVGWLIDKVPEEFEKDPRVYTWS